MSILIKGMEMPTDCDNCLLFDDRFDYPSCNATGHSRGYNWNPRGQRMPDCPLIEVPPHGDLVDINALKFAILDGDYVNEHDYLKGVLNEINHAPTVIDAESYSERELQRDYEASVEYVQHCGRYEPTYDPDTGAM